MFLLKSIGFGVLFVILHAWLVLAPIGKGAWHLLRNLAGSYALMVPAVTTTLTLTHESEQDLTRKDKQLLSEDFQKRGNIYLTVTVFILNIQINYGLWAVFE